MLLLLLIMLEVERSIHALRSNSAAFLAARRASRSSSSPSCTCSPVVAADGIVVGTIATQSEVSPLRLPINIER